MIFKNDNILIRIVIMRWVGILRFFEIWLCVEILWKSNEKIE